MRRILTVSGCNKRTKGLNIIGSLFLRDGNFQINVRVWAIESIPRADLFSPCACMLVNPIKYVQASIRGQLREA